MQDRETELMLRVAAGDDGAFTPLVALVMPRLFGYFRRLGVGRSDAEDLAQDVLLKVYRARGAYQARARFTTYLFHVARNHWIDVLRHRRLAPPTHSLEGSSADSEEFRPREPASGEPGPDAAGEAKRLGEALAGAVRALPADQREVYVLAQVEGLGYREIGEILGIPVGTVKSRVHGAVVRMRRWLRERGFEP